MTPSPRHLAVFSLALLLASCDGAVDDSSPGTDITVLLAYTSSVADSVAASNAARDAEAYVRRAVQETNEVYRQGRIPIRLVVAHVTEVDYRMTERLDDMRRLLAKDDGPLDELHVLRDQHEADVVVLIAEERFSTINAAVLATEETAFAIVWWNGLGDPGYGMAHELGHLHGARHAALTDPRNEPFPYGHGFRNDSLRTIMAGGPARLIPRFSGPDQTYEGVVLGDSSTADVARVLRETAVYISNFRGPVTPTQFVPPGTWPELPPE